MQLSHIVFHAGASNTEMAKNTGSSAFRKIDVDAFNEDNFRDDDFVGTGVAGNEKSPTGAAVSSEEVGRMLSRGEGVEALRAVLGQAPIGNKNQKEKDAALDTVMRVLMSIKSASAVEGAVKKLDNDQKDILMKYIYRGFEIPADGSSAHLLLWHEKVFEEAGVGSIVRVLTDRKKV